MNLLILGYFAILWTILIMFFYCPCGRKIQEEDKELEQAQQYQVKKRQIDEFMNEEVMFESYNRTVESIFYNADGSRKKNSKSIHNYDVM